MYPLMLRLSRLLAYLGGLMLLVLIVVSVASITGRALNGLLHADWMQANLPGLATLVLSTGIGPVNGDFELIESGIAFAIFAFLPLCQMTGGHATVDVFTSGLSDRASRVLRMVTEVVFAGVIVLIAVQLFDGMQSKRESGQTTFLIEFPVWWAYALSMVGATAAAVTAVYLAAMRVAEVAVGRALLPADLGADH